jgi:plastocyanin
VLTHSNRRDIPMRKLLLPLLVVFSLAAAGAAAGSASKTVTIAKTGYTPTAVSINTGDAVVFKNTDTVPHTVKLSSTTGVHCSTVTPLVIAAGQSASCTFSNAGKFKFSDAASNKKAFHGTITVTQPLVSSLAVAPKAVVYGNKATLSGKLASGQAGQSVQIHAQACGETKSTLVATVTTTTAGAFTYQAQPSKKTAYTLSNKGLTAGAAVSVMPSLHLSKVKRHHYRLQISAAQSFVGKVATFQRYRSKLRQWVKVKRVPLTSSAAGTAPTVITSAKFRSTIKARLRVRATLGAKQVGPCYLAGRSNTIRS